MKKAAVFAFLGLMVLLLALYGCGSQSSVSVPSVDLFPTSTGVDVAALKTAGAVSTQSVSILGTYSNTVSSVGTVVANIVDNDDSLFNNIFTIVNQFETKLATNTTQKSFSAVLDGATKTVKIDFADFDFNGDGALEGSSGTASFADSAGAAKPVTVRIWINDERALAGLLQNKNQGTMYVKPSVFTPSTRAADLQFKAEYSQDNDSKITVTGSGTVLTGVTISNGKFYVHYEPSTAINYVNFNCDFSAHTLGYNTLGAISKFDTAYMEISSWVDDVQTLNEQDVDLNANNSGNVPMMALTDAKYSITGLALIDNANASTLGQFPTAFPATPTF